MDPELFVGSGSGTRGFGSGFGFRGMFFGTDWIAQTLLPLRTGSFFFKKKGDLESNFRFFGPWR
jgi:hypothetical protein